MPLPNLLAELPAGPLRRDRERTPLPHSGNLVASSVTDGERRASSNMEGDMDMASLHLGFGPGMGKAAAPIGGRMPTP